MALCLFCRVDLLKEFAKFERLSAVPEEAQRQLAAFGEYVVEANTRLNLTRITEPRPMARDHFADSLAAIEAAPQAFQRAEKALDIGSGAGFPVVPLAIVTPHVRWTAVESIAKKCRFMEQAVKHMKLANVQIMCARAEDIGRSGKRESYDLVTARAVGAIASLCEVGLPMLKTGGALLLYKTETALKEYEAARQLIVELGGKPESTYEYRFEGDEMSRLIFVVAKISPTPPQHPRPAGVPFKKPLA